MVYCFPLQLEKYSFYVILHSGFLIIKNKENNIEYKCNLPPIHINYQQWCDQLFSNLKNPFSSLEEYFVFHQWAISPAYIGVDDSPMLWEVAQELAK